MANIERPKLKINFDRSSQSLVINNAGNVEAINCVLLYIKNEKCKLLNYGELFAVSPDIRSIIETETNKDKSGRFSLILAYENPLDKKVYMHGVQVEASENILQQLTESSHFKYSDFIKIYTKSLSYSSSLDVVYEVKKQVAIYDEKWRLRIN